jgi:hypothetical protein
MCDSKMTHFEALTMLRKTILNSQNGNKGPDLQQTVTTVSSALPATI